MAKWHVKRRERLKQQLGVDVSTARNKLKVNFMLYLAEKCGMNICFRCKEAILCADDLSLDHKLPWEGLDDGKELFWSQDNLALSHLSCNRNAARRVYRRKGIAGMEVSPLRKSGPKGTAYCSLHQKFLPIAEFNKNRARWNGLQDTCRNCRSIYRKKYWKT